MRIFIFFLFLTLINCSSTGIEKRVYICGDHPCSNKKEVKDYFDNNISIEVYTISSDKMNKENFDLVELNLLKDKLKSKEKITVLKKEKDIYNKVNNYIYNNINTHFEIILNDVTASLYDIYSGRSDIKCILEKNNKLSNEVKIKEIPKKKKASQFTFVRICKNLEECDIDKISKIIMDIGKEKDYPNIN